MGHRDEAMAAQCCSALGRLVASDAAGDGSAARDAVQLVADLVKLRRCTLLSTSVSADLGCLCCGTEPSESIPPTVLVAQTAVLSVHTVGFAGRM